MLMLFAREQQERYLRENNVIEDWQREVSCGDSICVPNWRDGVPMLVGVYEPVQPEPDNDYVVGALFHAGKKYKKVRVWRGHIMLAVNVTLEELSALSVLEAQRPMSGYVRMFRQAAAEGAVRMRNDLRTILAEHSLARQAAADPAFAARLQAVKDHIVEHGELSPDNLPEVDELEMPELDDPRKWN